MNLRSSGADLRNEAMLQFGCPWRSAQASKAQQWAEWIRVGMGRVRNNRNNELGKGHGTDHIHCSRKQRHHLLKKCREAPFPKGRAHEKKGPFEIFELISISS